MTAARSLLFDARETLPIAETSHASGKYAIEALGTFGLQLTVGVAVCSGNPVAAVGIGIIVMTVIYAGGYRAGAHFNPAITLAALVWGRVTLPQATRYWCAQLIAGLGAALTWRIADAEGQAETGIAMMLGGRTLLAALAAQLLFTLAVAYVVFSCTGFGEQSSNALSGLAIGVAVLAGGVDLAAVFGGVYLVSQVIAGAFAGIAFLTFGSAAR